ncbi:MAG: nicotinic acid mononucleotide adenylyltransferase [Crocinitomicaceae bacterium]|jgi:nicotinate-nucleotide adenylyltransferase|nr:nicotinic acid mononucleotide adenylyltransferase [Crocinitomicaceae bacterium]
MKIGLFFGTFNPIHVGHLIIAGHMANGGELDQVWLVVSPHNPLKNKKTLLADHHRLQLVRLAVDDNPKLRASDIEFALSQPNYTVHTLAHLKEKYPQHEFSLILGEDNLRTFNKWYNYEYILENHTVFVYPRNLTAQETEEEKLKTDAAFYNEVKSHPNVRFCEDTPVMKISSSFIRESIQNGKEVRYLLTEPVFRYVDEMNFYK